MRQSVLVLSVVLTLAGTSQPASSAFLPLRQDSPGLLEISYSWPGVEGGRILDVEVEGNLAYLAAGAEGLQVVDVSDPANPVQLGDWHGNALEVVGNYIYLADRGGRSIIEILPNLIIPSEAIQDLIQAIGESSLTDRRERPLQASLKAALASVERGQINAAINQLNAFQNQVRAQITRIEPQLAGDLIGAAQEIVDALTPPEPGPISNMVCIEPGTFIMGSPVTERMRSFEFQHVVTISRGYWMGKYEVTQAEYLDVVGANPSYFRNGTNALDGGLGGPVTDESVHPVERVSWFDAANFCALLTERERSAGRLPEGYVYRLPTEAEWEYACRAGTTTAFCYGEELRSGMASFNGRYEYVAAVGTINNPEGIYLGRTTEVGGYEPNAWGLYDMHGNVYEWCHDRHDWGDYPEGPMTDPTGPETGSERKARGGHWADGGGGCRSAHRAFDTPDSRHSSIGFRVVLGHPYPLD